MKCIIKTVILIVLLGAIVITCCGCRTWQMLTKVETGHVDPRDIWHALEDDDAEFQHNYW